MPTLAPPTTTEYLVIFHWCASSWDGMEDEDGEIDYDSQPFEDSQAVVVSLPYGSTPWDVYSEANAIAKPPSIPDGVDGWAPDGLSITIGENTALYSGLNPDTTWDKSQSI